MDQARPEEMTAQATEPNPTVLGSVLVFGHAVKHMFNGGFFVVLPELQIHMGLSNSAIGTLSTVRNIGSGLANVPGGYLGDRFSDRRPLILAASMAGVGVFHLLMGTASSYWSLTLMATLASVCISFWHPPAIAALAQRFVARRGLAISLHGAGGSVGEALGPISVGALLGVLFWRSVLQISAIPALATAVLTWSALRGLRGVAAKPISLKTYAASVYHMVSSPALVSILIITAGMSSVQAVVITFLPIYLRVDLGYDALVMSAFISASQVVGIVSQPTMGFLSDRYTRKAVLLPSLVLLGLAVVAVPLVGKGLALLLVVALMGAFSFPLMAVVLAAAMDVVGGDTPATTVSLVFGSAIIFSAFMPAVAGILADAYGVQAVFFLSAGMAFATAGFTALRKLSR